MIIPIIVFIVALAMLIYETRRMGRKWPKVRGWWFRAALLNGAQIGTVYLAGLTWDKWFFENRVWSLEHLGPTLGGLIGYLVITFIFYWWHRVRHKSNFLWRWIHQVHHSPKRLEILTAFYKHPFELALDSMLSSFILFPLLGLGPVAAAYAVLLSAFAELCYHWNVNTPYWVGFIFQRPESHCVHHQDGLHSYNYADLPLWDMLFGTFKNPKVWDGQCGLGEGEHRLNEMMVGVDVSRKKQRKMGTRWAAVFLLTVGLLQMFAHVIRSPKLKGLAAAFGASPAPKVFCTADSLETFSSQFILKWKDQTGEQRSLLLTPERASKIKGPYNRRNVYGAILSYGPVLEANPLTRPLYESVLSYGLQGAAPLLKEIGIDPKEIDEKVLISLSPLRRDDVKHLNLEKEVFLK